MSHRLRRLAPMLALLLGLLLLGGCLPCPPCPECPEATPAPTATAPPAMLCWDPRLAELGVTVERRSGNYWLAGAWLTINGNWDDVPACAKPWQSDVLGGDHHLYGRLETAAGTALDNTFVVAWGSGPEDGDARTPEWPAGWANIPIAGQNWDPNEGPGPYTWFCFGGDRLVGLGMPNNHHYSFFGVWRPVDLYAADVIEWWSLAPAPESEPAGRE